ncbi:MAG: MMPL family transporter [Patulibacter minatonensis]
MSLRLAALARWLTHHWVRGLLGFLAVVVVLIALAANGKPAADDFSIPGTDTQSALDLLNAHTPNLAGLDSQLVFYAKPAAKIDDPASRQAIEGALEKVRKLDHVVAAASPFGAQGGGVSPDKTVALVTVQYDPKVNNDLDKDDGLALEKAADSAKGPGVDVAARGPLIDLAAEPSAPVGELAGIGLAIVLLVLLFRSGSAMFVTLFSGLLGVFLGQLLLAGISGPLGLPKFAATIAVMLGLGAGIDYALLLIARFREQMALGDSARDAMAKSAATAGSAVVTAGLIVMVAIAGLLAIGIPIIGKMGIGAAIGVFAVVLSAVAVLPIFVGMLKRFLRPRKWSHVAPSHAFGRWGQIVTERPWVSMALGVIVLLIFASPLTGMRLGQPDDGNRSADETQRIAYDKLSQAFGPGSNGPFLIVTDVKKGTTADAPELKRLQAAIAGTKDVALASPAAISEDGEIAISSMIPKTSPQDERTSDLLKVLRDDVVPNATKGTDLKVFIGGNTAALEDLSAKTASGLPIFIAAVIGLSVLLLMAAFRSIWIPLVSAVFNLLSVGAAYGIVTAVFQDQVGGSLLGIDNSVPILFFVPVMIFAILFGLSMDYNVFLLSRVHEAYKEGDGPRESVIHGMARIGKVILVAGLIMSVVFLSFMTQSDVGAQMMGLGLGAAILIDVLIVRLVIAPAVVTVLGDKAWTLPKWLDRILPNVSLEGHLVEGKDPKGVSLEPVDAPVDPLVAAG